MQHIFCIGLFNSGSDGLNRRNTYLGFTISCPISRGVEYLLDRRSEGLEFDFGTRHIGRKDLKDSTPITFSLIVGISVESLRL